MSIGRDTILLKSRISEKKKRRKDMVIRADTYIIRLRDLIDPYFEDFTEINLDAASVILADFMALQCEAKDLDRKIARMEKDLNG